MKTNKKISVEQRMARVAKLHSEGKISVETLERRVVAIRAMAGDEQPTKTVGQSTLC